jgi:signal transduction histidine kinase
MYEPITPINRSSDLITASKTIQTLDLDVNSIRSYRGKDTHSELFRDLLDHLSNFVMVFGSVRDSSGIISDFSLKFANRNAGLLNIDDVHNFNGKNMSEILPESITHRFGDHIADVVESGNPFEEEFLFESEKSEKKWLHCLIRKYGDGFVATFHDISARKREVQRTSELNEQLRYTNAQKDKLFSIIAHDFRSPFAGCLGMLEMVLEDKDSYDRAELYEMLEMIYKQSQSTFHLLESLLDWASVQQGQLNYAPVNTDLKALADLMCNMLGSDAMEKKIELLNRIPEQTFVSGDTYMLKTILRNLISNGIKFTNPGGRIVIDAWKKGAMIEISVCDNGIGIQKSSQEKIFDIDYQYIGRGTKGEKGTGIGLHVCRDFVHKHGGEILVESEPGKGSTFRITLPAT